MAKNRFDLKKYRTLFEDLPNETLISIFSYLNGVDTVWAFSNLNYRLYCLSNLYCYSFDFESVNKTKFDLIFHQQQNKYQWKSLQLCNEQFEYLSQFSSLINLCPELQSLSLLNIKSISLNNYLLLSKLSKLTLGPICGMIISEFDLSKLKRLVITSCENMKWIKDLCQLENLEYTINNYNCSCQSSYIWPITLKQLKIIFQDSYHIYSVQKSFIYLPQLTTLEMYQDDPLKYNHEPDGRIWEELISSLFPLLKHFQFYFQCFIGNLKEILALFSTPFYLIEKKWLIRCDFSYKMSSDKKASHNGYDHKGIFYSLPLTFQPTFVYTDRYYNSLSTSLDNFQSNMYTQLKTLVVNDDMKYLNEDFKRIQIMNLTINRSINSISCTSILTKLQHLSFNKHVNNFSSNIFEILLINSPNLYSLEIDNNLLDILTENWTNISICDQLSKKIRQLKFYSAKNSFQCFSKNRLITILPRFASKCTYLSLSIQSKVELIILILKRMKKLDYLHIHIKEKDHQPITMEWFEQNKTKFHHSDCFLMYKEQNYYFWLGKSFSSLL